MLIQNKEGRVGSRELFILGIITMATAIIIVVVFIILSSGKSKEPSSEQNILDSIPTRQDREESQNSGENEQDNQQSDAIEHYPTKTYTGTITNIQGTRISVTNPDTKEIYQVVTTKDTQATYQGKSFETSKLHAGDQIEVLAQLKTGAWQAVTIKITLSASPEVPAVIPEKVDVRPDGTIKPL